VCIISLILYTHLSLLVLIIFGPLDCRSPPRYIFTMKTILIGCGTRPDVLKLAPVWAELRLNPRFTTKIWWSGQGKDIFPVEHQYMVDNSSKIAWSSLNEGIADTIKGFDDAIYLYEPDLVVTHGDDATAYACTLAAFNRSIPVAHVEAGLRTYRDTPHPEEAYRRSIALMASMHFAPDTIARLNLIQEYIPHDRIFITGNTINDVMRAWAPAFNGNLDILVTLHRRENTGRHIASALNTLGLWAIKHNITVIKHPNWQDQYDLSKLINFIDPVPHDELLNLMSLNDFVVTDSGGLQEECAFLGCPCIVYREETERTALLNSGAIILAPPSDPDSLDDALRILLRRQYAYGNGTAGLQIARLIEKRLGTCANVAGVEAIGGDSADLPG